MDPNTGRLHMLELGEPVPPGLRKVPQRLASHAEGIAEIQALPNGNPLRMWGENVIVRKVAKDKEVARRRAAKAQAKASKRRNRR